MGSDDIDARQAQDLDGETTKTGVAIDTDTMKHVRRPLTYGDSQSERIRQMLHVARVVEDYMGMRVPDGQVKRFFEAHYNPNESRKANIGDACQDKENLEDSEEES